MKPDQGGLTCEHVVTFRPASFCLLRLFRKENEVVSATCDVEELGGPETVASRPPLGYDFVLAWPALHSWQGGAQQIAELGAEVWLEAPTVTMPSSLLLSQSPRSKM